MSTVLRIAGKAVIVYEGKVLILKEAGRDSYSDSTNAGKYQLPGGRIEVDETFMEGFEREIMEETGLKVKPIKPIFVRDWWPVIKGQKNHIVGVYMLCEADTTDVVLSNEHDAFEWIDPNEATNFDIIEIEREIVVLAAKNNA